MKRRQIKELSTKSKNELVALLVKEQEDLAKINLERKARRLKNVALISEKKKDIARINTFINILKTPSKHENT